MNEKEKIRLKISPDGHIGHLLRGPIRVVAISWSRNDQSWHIRFCEADYAKAPIPEATIQEALSIIKAYKEEADRLEIRRQACMIAFNK